MIGTEGGDFYDFATKVDMHQFKAATDDSRIAKFGPHLFGRRAGGDVEVFWRDVEQHVAYATTDQIGLITGVLQAFDDIDRVPAELGTLQRVLAAVEHFRGAAQLLRATLGGTE